MITGDNETCEGHYAILSTNDSTGEFITHQWSTGETTPTASAYGGWYTVTVTDERGCAGVSDSFRVVMHLSPVPQIIGSLAYCHGDSATLQVTGDTVIFWSTYTNGQTVRVTSADNPVWVMVENQYGCVGYSADVNVAPNTVLSPVIAGDAEYCNGGYSTLNAGIYDSYNWSNGATTQTIPAITGTYSVTVSGGGCSGTSPQFSVSELAAITGTQTLSGCVGYSVTIGVNTYNASGTYTDVLPAANGCDSTVTTYLTIFSPDTVTQAVSGCPGYFTVVGNDTLTGSGYYTHILSNQYGCDSIVFTLLSLTEAPSLNLPPDDTLCTTTGDTLVLNCGYQGATNYLWSDNSTGQTTTIHAAAMTPGIYVYTVAVTDNGCTAHDTILVNIETCTGIMENRNGSRVSVYPNPAKDALFVETTGETEKIEFYDITGKACLETSLHNKRADIGSLSNGLYFYRIWLKVQSEPKTGKIEVMK